MQATSYFNQPKVKVTPVSWAEINGRMEHYMRFSDSLRELHRRDENAWMQMVRRMDNQGETWQAIEPDVLRELERLDALEQADEITGLRGY